MWIIFVMLMIGIPFSIFYFGGLTAGLVFLIGAAIGLVLNVAVRMICSNNH